MEKFKKSINKSIKVVTDEIFLFCETHIGGLQGKIDSHEETIKHHEQELKEISSKYESQISELNENHQKLREDYENLKTDYENYKKVSLVKTLHEKLDTYQREIEILRNKLEKQTSNNKSIALDIKEKAVKEVKAEVVKEEAVKAESVEAVKAESVVDVEEEAESVVDVEEEAESVVDVEEEVESVDVEEEVEESVEEVEESEEEISFLEKKIRGKKYYVTDDDDREIYEMLKNGDVGEQVGAYVNNRSKFFKK